MTSVENRVQIFEGMLFAMLRADSDRRGDGDLIAYDDACDMAFRFRDAIRPLYPVSDGEFFRIVNRILGFR